MDAKRFFCVSAALLGLAISPHLSSGQTIVGTAKFQSEGSAALVVMSNGDFYKSSMSEGTTTNPWTRAGTFNSAIVGVSRLPGSPERVYAITPTGDLLWASISSIGLSGNIFQLSGRRTDAVVALGSDEAGLLIVSTQRGDVYLANPGQMHLPNAVTYAGNIYGAAAAPQTGTWGQVKSTYR
jgi:hypothetical protein